MKRLAVALSLILCLVGPQVHADGIFNPGSGGGAGCSPAGVSGNILLDNGAGGCSSDSNATASAGALTLGASGMLGQITFGNATSGTINLQPVTGALGTVNLTMPATSGTVALTSQLASLPLSAANGGTGVNNGSNTITLGGTLTTTGAGAATLAFPATAAAITMPTPATSTLAYETVAPTSGHCAQWSGTAGLLADSGGACGGSGTPGGASTDVQFNNTGAFGGDSGFTYAGSGQATLALGTITTNLKALNITGTWNAVGTTFDAPFSMNITNTASASASALMDLQVGGVSMFRVSPVTTNQGIVDIAIGSTEIAATGAIIHTSVTSGTGNIIEDVLASSEQHIYRRTNGTVASPTALASGDVIGQLEWQGYNGAAYKLGADIEVKAAEAWSGTANGGYLQFFTTAPTTTALSERMRLENGLSVGNSVVGTDPGDGVVLHAPQAFASLAACSSALEGAVAEVNNSNTATWGATIAGGGTNKVMAHCNAVNWTVMGD